MTLTEQWEKGELDKTFYYIKYNDDSIRTDLSVGKANGLDFCNSKEVKEVLAPVPSYDEWKQLHKFLEEFNALDVAKENQQLKELLYSLKCCLTSENIEPQIRVEKSLAKIEEFLTDGK